MEAVVVLVAVVVTVVVVRGRVTKVSANFLIGLQEKVGRDFCHPPSVVIPPQGGSKAKPPMATRRVTLASSEHSLFQMFYLLSSDQAKSFKKIRLKS